MGVDQHEPNQGLRRGSIAPGVVRPALNQHVALPQQHLGCIENGPDLALQHEGVVYGGGAMHARVTCGAGMIDGLAARFAEVAERLVAPPGRDIVFVRRELDDPEDRAPRRRRKGDLAETRQR